MIFKGVQRIEGIDGYDDGMGVGRGVKKLISYGHQK